MESIAGDENSAGISGISVPENGGDGHRYRRRMSREHRRRLHRRRVIKRIAIVVGLILAVLIALGMWFGVSAMKVRNEVAQAMSAATAMKSALTNADQKAFSSGSERFSDHAGRAYRETSSVLWSVAEKTPYYGRDVSVVRAAVTAMENMSSQVISPIDDAAGAVMMTDASFSGGTIRLPDLDKYADSLDLASQALHTTIRSLDEEPTAHVSQIASAVSKAKSYMTTVSGILDNATAFAKVAPSMLTTTGGTRTYLLLAQTNSELRASGGLPGSWGIVTISNGKVELQGFTAEGGLPWLDEPVVELTSEEKSLFTDKLGRMPQDVNLTPDFSRTGTIARAMWKKTHNVEVDGVIAIDPVFLQNMLAVTGGVKLDDGTVLDGSTTAKYLLSDVYAAKDTSEQDRYFSEAAAAAFQHIITSSSKPRDFLKAASTSVAGGHVLVWSAHEDEQNVLEDTDISGTLETRQSNPQVGVYFSDGTQSKMDWYLRRRVRTAFQKTAANGVLQYTVTITLTNMMTTSQIATTPQYVLGDQKEGVTPGDINTAMYVYAPAGGRLVDWSMSDGKGFDIVSVHDGLTVGGRSITLKPGESMKIVVHVQSSPGIVTPLTLRQTPQIPGRTD